MRTGKQTFKIVMIPAKGTRQSMSATNLILEDHRKQLFFADNPSIYGWGHQHLCILSNDDITTMGDCYLDHETNQVLQYSGNSFDGILQSNTGITSPRMSCIKVIAYTDKSMMPNSWIPESFVKAYIKAFNEGKPITEVDLEMIELFSENGEHWKTNKGASESLISKFELKTRCDNSVIINHSKLYSRKELDLFFEYANQSDNEDIGLGELFDKWILKNHKP